MRMHVALAFAGFCLVGTAGCGGGGGTAPVVIPPGALVFARSPYKGGTCPSQVSVADMDCDGVPDLVSRSPADASLTIQLCTRPVGLRGIDKKDIYRVLVRESSTDFAIADLNQDGRPDLVVSAADPGGGLTAHLTDPNLPGPLFATNLNSSRSNIYRVTAGDVDGDGRADIVALDEPGGEAVLLLNSGPTPGAFPGPDLPLPVVGVACSDLALADVDLDGRLDVVTLGSDGSVVFLRQGAALTFTQKKRLPANFREPQLLAVGDVNGDGRPDVVVACGGGAPEYRVLLQSPANPDDFTALPAIQAGAPITGLGLADFDRDGDLDLLSTETDAQGVRKVTILTGAEGIGFEPGNRIQDAQNQPITVGGAAKPSAPGSAQASSVKSSKSNTSDRVADMDGDGYLDICVADGVASVQVLLRAGAPPQPIAFTQAPPLALPPGITPGDVVVGDVNADGKADLVNGIGDRIHVHLQDPAHPMTFLPPVVSPSLAPELNSLALGDVDGDGRVDIAFAGGTGALGVLWQSAVTRGVFDSSTSTGLPATSCRGVSIADLNGDGKPDVATTSPFGGGVVYAAFRDPASPRAFFAEATYAVDSPQPVDLEAVDLDCDGKPDLAVACADDTLSVLLRSRTLGAAAPGAGPPPVSSLYGPPDLYSLAGGVRVAAGDVNGDGRADLVTVDGTGASLTFQTDAELGVFQPAQRLRFGPPPSGAPVPGAEASLAVLDVDQDGRVDILACDGLDETFTVFRNDPAQPSSFGVKALPRTEVAKRTVVATGDVNGDGWADVVAATGAPPGAPGGKIFIWTQIPGPH